MDAINARARKRADRDLTDEQRVAALINDSAALIKRSARMIRAAGGLDLALRALAQVADDLRREKL